MLFFAPRASRRAKRSAFSFDSLEARRLLSTLVALIDSGVDLSVNSAYYDLTYAYDAYNKVPYDVGLGNASIVTPLDPYGPHGPVVAQRIVDGIVDAKSQTGAAAADVKIMPIGVTQ